MSTVVGSEVPANESIAPAQGAIEHLLVRGLVHTVYQPIVDLHRGEVIGYEALVRGAPGSRLESPLQLFRAAREANRLSELDWLCRRRALEGALAAGLPPELVLFVNMEPEVAASLPPRLEALLDDMSGQIRVVMEITERALTERPAELLELVRRTRQRGWGIALDDVGADSRSLALMPLLEPDVIKLDMRLVQQRPDSEIASIVAAVNAQAERTGASVLAEGIETAQHEHAALAMGARFGQGWRFGRPGPLPTVHVGPFGHLAFGARRSEDDGTPYQQATASHAARRPRLSTKPLLLAMSRHLENQALGLGSTAVVLGAFQHERHFTPHTAERYARLAQGAAFVGALGREMPTQPAVGVRGASLATHDPLGQEWDVLVVSPHFAATLVARDLGDAGPENRRRFDYVLSYDRDRAVRAARALLRRFAVTGEPVGRDGSVDETR